MNGSNALSQVGGIYEKLNNEINIRSKVEDGMAMIQSEINQLKQVVTNTTTMSTPIMSATMDGTTNNGNPTQLPPNPLIYPAPQMVYPAPRFQVPAYQQPPQQINLVTQVNLLNGKLQSLQQEFNKSNNNINDLYDDLGRLRNELNEQRQYDQRNNLIAHGWDDQEYAEEFTKYVVDKLNKLFPDIEGGISDRDIDDTHIYHTKSSVRDSPKQLVIIRFCSRLMRNKIFSIKKGLKNTGFSITEHLTQYNLKLLKAAQKRLGDAKRAWTHYGKVIINHDGVIKSVRNFGQLDYYLTGNWH